MTEIAEVQLEETHQPKRLHKAYYYLIWLPFVGVIVGMGFYYDFISHAFMSQPALNGMIFGAMLWGTYTMVANVHLTFKEDRVFSVGMDQLKKGVWRQGQGRTKQYSSGKAHVLGMLGRLEKMGLGHNVYMQSATMDPELDSLAKFFAKKQELSQYLTGLMVGLGLLGTFIGLLETLVATSALIESVANGTSSGGGNIENEFTRVVGGLAQPLASMGVAFSASMFGLVGSIMLGFQMVIVRKCSGDFVNVAREHVLSLAEKTTVGTNVQITERFLGTLLADILEQHKKTTAHLENSSAHIAAAIPQFSELGNKIVHQVLTEVREQQQETLKSIKEMIKEMHDFLPLLQTTVNEHRNLRELVSVQTGEIGMAAESIRDVSRFVPLLKELGIVSQGVFKEARIATKKVESLTEVLPEQVRIREAIEITNANLLQLKRELESVHQKVNESKKEARQQSARLRQVDASLISLQKANLKDVLNDKQSK
jgi:hypothetical protein